MIGDAKIGAVIRKIYSMNLSGQEMKMLITILVHTNNFGVCDLSNEELAKKNDCSERAISTMVKKLTEREIISVVLNHHKHKRLIYVRNLVNKSVKFNAEPPLEKMSPEQRMFKDAFPDKIVDCNVPDNVDMPKLIQEIGASQFLLNHAKNMTLYSYCVKFYKLIMSGHYTDSAFVHDKDGNIVQRKKFSSGHDYKKTDVNSLFQDPETVEV